MNETNEFLRKAVLCTDKPATAEAEIKPNKFFSASARLELNGMKTSIMHYINENALKDIGPVLDEIVKKVMSEGFWRDVLETEVRKQMEGLFQKAVKDAIEYNDDVRRHVRSVVEKEVVKALKSQIRRTK